MKKCKVVHCKREPCDVYIGRPSKWSNPFSHKQNTKAKWIVNSVEEAVLITKPVFFGHGGVDKNSIKTGREFVALTTDYVIVNMQPIQREVQFEDMMSSDGVPLDFHSVIRLQVVDAVKLISNFGPKWYENNLEAKFNSAVRQAVKKHGMNETAIKSDAIEEIDAEIMKVLTKEIQVSELPVKLLDVTVGKANPPDSVKDQRIATAKQQQRIITERERKLAEDERYAAEQARAKADNAYRESMHLDPNQFLSLEKIKMQHKVCAKSKCTFFIDGNVTPVANLK